MAIGLAAIMGFKLCENFRSPYQSTDITEFWRRWHISLSTWLRDYVYIPLGGNRKGAFMQQVNQLLTMLIGGLWHGASWRFIAWGGLHGVALVGHKLFSKTALGKSYGSHPLMKAFGWLLTFNIVAFLWVLFRVPSIEVAYTSMNQIFSDVQFLDFVLPFWRARPLLVVMMLGGFALTLMPKAWKDRISLHFMDAPMAYRFLWLIVVVHLSLELAGQGVQPFIYFQF
jgi:D-alanyl-lipoteichoic acid acyltransferase DltB (MBOAT superfamily)